MNNFPRVPEKRRRSGRATVTAGGLMVVLASAVIGALEINATDNKATEEIVYRCELKYDGNEKGDLTPVFFQTDGSGRKGNKVEKIWVASGDSVTVTIHDPGQEKVLGNWEAKFKWEEGRKNKTKHKATRPYTRRTTLDGTGRV